MEKKCNEKQILNPISNRCVNKKGIIGKKLLIQNEKIHLFWNNNSCYIDSFLVALFHNKNKFFLNYPLIIYKNSKLNFLVDSINYQLNILYDIISNRKKNNNCNLLRKNINLFYKKITKINSNIKIIDKNENWTNSQLDIFDLFNLFQHIYNFPNNLKFKEGNNINYSSFIFNIPIDLLINKNIIYIKKIFPSYNIKNNNLIITTTLLKTDMLFLNVFRNLQTFKLDTKIIPANIIKLPENSFNLYLTSLIIHYGNYDSGHFICLYKSNNKWFEYDDLQKSPIYLGSLNKIIQNDNYISNIVGLIYSKNVNTI
jgi:hypothetical protein